MDTVSNHNLCPFVTFSVSLAKISLTGLDEEDSC